MEIGRVTGAKTLNFAADDGRLSSGAPREQKVQTSPLLSALKDKTPYHL